MRLAILIGLTTPKKRHATRPRGGEGEKDGMTYSILARVLWTGLGAATVEEAAKQARAFLDQSLNRDSSFPHISVEITAVLEGDAQFVQDAPAAPAKEKDNG